MVNSPKFGKRNSGVRVELKKTIYGNSSKFGKGNSGVRVELKRLYMVIVPSLEREIPDQVGVKTIYGNSTIFGKGNSGASESWLRRLYVVIYGK